MATADITATATHLAAVWINYHTIGLREGMTNAEMLVKLRAHLKTPAQPDADKDLNACVAKMMSIVSKLDPKYKAQFEPAVFVDVPEDSHGHNRHRAQLPANHVQGESYEHGTATTDMNAAQKRGLMGFNPTNARFMG